MSLNAGEYLSREARAWWRAGDYDACARAMIPVCEAIEEGADYTARRRQNLRHLKLYANRDLTSIYESGVAVETYDAGVWLTMNIVQSCVDTVAAKLWKTPRIQASVQDGDYSLKQRAKKLSRFADGVFFFNKWTRESRMFGVDSTLFGSGVVLAAPETPTDEDGEIVIERVLCDELLFDETEAVRGLKSLRSIYRKRWIHRELLIDRWCSDKRGKAIEETRQAILLASGADPRGFYALEGGDMVPVYEGWHLPSRKGAKDGRHIIAIKSAGGGFKLFGGDWTRTRFSLSFLPWNPLPCGLLGRSLAEELVPIQIKINDTIEVIDAGQNLMCVPKVFVRGDTMNMDTWTNAFAELIKVNSPGPLSDSIMVTTPPGVSAEMYREREYWWRHGFETTGLSALSATGEKPEGVGSAVALRELLDREDMRFVPKGKQWEESNVDVFESVIDAADELYQANKRVKVQVPRESLIEQIDWTDVNMERDKYVLRADAVSSLPSTPQGRKQYAVELWQLGAVSREQFLSMLELPDTTSTMNLILASLDLCERAMEIMVEQGRYEPPEEYSDLVLSRTVAMQTYMRERLEGAPESVLYNIARYVDECTELLANAGQAEQPAATQAVQAEAGPAAGAAIEQPLLPVPAGMAQAAPAVA